MEPVMVSSCASPDFNFESSCSSPYISAPSTPKRFGGGDLYFSAPTSPTRSSTFYQDFNNLSFTANNTSRRSSSSVIPFDWEEKPGTPKSPKSKDDPLVDNDEDFAFIGCPQNQSPLTADELFERGKIRPLKPPPCLQPGADDKSVFFPSSPRSPIKQGKKMIRNVFSMKKEIELDPFEIAIEKTRAREWVSGSSSKSINRTRSLSPLRVPYEQPQPPQPQTPQTQHKTTPINSKEKNEKRPSKGYRKWRLRDFLLFRSASEGRASERDLLRKYSKNEDVKNSSFRSTDSSGSGSGSRRRGPPSAHELHYTTNRAVSEELKKKTFLPYRQGFFGCMGFNPALQGIAKGFNI